MIRMILFSVMTFLLIDFVRTDMTGKSYYEIKSAYAADVYASQSEVVFSDSKQNRNGNGNGKGKGKGNPTQQVPEPSTFILLSTAIAGLGAYKFLKKRKK